MLINIFLCKQHVIQINMNTIGGSIMIRLDIIIIKFASYGPNDPNDTKWRKWPKWHKMTQITQMIPNDLNDLNDVKSRR